MKKFLAALALILAASACAEVLNGGDESATTSTAPARPPTGNLRSDYYTTVGSYVTTADGRRERGCASTDTVYDGEGTCHVGGETVVVREVLDGDTVDLADGRRVRILGVDTPEVGTCGADVVVVLFLVVVDPVGSRGRGADAPGRAGGDLLTGDEPPRVDLTSTCSKPKAWTRGWSTPVDPHPAWDRGSTCVRA
jgi:hypothetical protein